jgi:5-(carboxyamino)imidazole ribonucleotide synthase
MMQELDIPVAPFFAVSSRPDLAAAVAEIGLPCVLKTRRLGYDGKGQMVLRFEEDMERAWQQLGDFDLICEGYVPFDLECSIIAARGGDGETVFWPLTRNLHRDGILSISTAPAFDLPLQRKAEELVKRLLDHLDYRGVLALELFLADGELLANEFAPRVHNSGHWSIDGANTSQFENHLRAICSLPLGNTEAHSNSLMFNLLGQMPDAFKASGGGMGLPIAGLHWHDYGKTPRAGRKIGHVTVVADSQAELAARAGQLAAKLGVSAELDLENVSKTGQNFPSVDD